MYITVQEVRDRGKLLTTGVIADADIKRFIIDAESYINMCLAKLYITPVIPLVKPDGTVSVTINTKTITGVNTLFESNNDLMVSNHIYLVNSREVAVVDTVTSDTMAMSVTSFENSINDSPFYIIPEEICTATRYYAAKLILDWKFSEQAFNQNTEKVTTNYEDFASKILKLMEGQKYYNALLTPRPPEQTLSRAIGTYQSFATESNQRIIDEYTSWWN